MDIVPPNGKSSRLRESICLPKGNTAFINTSQSCFGVVINEDGTLTSFSVRTPSRPCRVATSKVATVRNELVRRVKEADRATTARPVQPQWRTVSAHLRPLAHTP